MQKKNLPLNIQRLPEHEEDHYELKDPSVVQLSDGSYMMYASVGNSMRQEWKVGRFVASDLFGQWQELSPVTFHNLGGPQLCAPAVMYEVKDGQPLWSMYIQTACFEEDGIIALATSTDGEHFYGQPQPLASRHTIGAAPNSVIGVYDVGVSEVKHGEEDILCMLYSGYRRVGCGDIYISTKKKHESEWSIGECLVSQEDVPFHNHPDYEHYEWGLEGAKLIQLSPTCFMLIGVCFMPKPDGYLGTRQRVFLAVSDNINGPFRHVGMPFMPQKNQWNTGENGHPDTIIVDNELVVIYQERSGDGHPWQFRVSSFDLKQLQAYMEAYLRDAQQPTHLAPSAFAADSMATRGTTSHRADPEEYHLNFPILDSAEESFSFPTL